MERQPESEEEKKERIHRAKQKAKEITEKSQGKAEEYLEKKEQKRMNLIKQKEEEEAEFKRKWEDPCPICRQKLYELCFHCLGEPSIVIGSCSISKGTCGHTFHSHCIQYRRSNASKCPMCHEDWDVESVVHTALPNK